MEIQAADKVRRRSTLHLVLNMLSMCAFPYRTPVCSRGYRTGRRRDVPKTHGKPKAGDHRLYPQRHPGLIFTRLDKFCKHMKNLLIILAILVIPPFRVYPNG